MTLAQTGNCLIDYCQDCQVMHVHLDSISLKIRRESLTALGELIQEALCKLQRLEDDTSALLHHLSRPRQGPH